MAVRILSGIVGLPILVGLVYFGGISLRLAVLAAALIGMKEFYHAFSEKPEPVHKIGYATAVVYMAFIDQIINYSNLFNIFVSLFLVVLLVYTVVMHKTNTINQSLITFFGFFYVCFLISHVILVREFTYGKFFVWLIFISAWGCDTGAYFSGVAFGRHKLIPDLSPKKTVEGAVGGVFLATLIGFFYGFFMERNFAMQDVNSIFLCTAACAVGAVVAQIGDLAASAIKRYTKIKDYGNLIPGHGGILDRFDSVLLTAPCVYYMMFLLMVAK